MKTFQQRFRDAIERAGTWYGNPDLEALEREPDSDDVLALQAEITRLDWLAEHRHLLARAGDYWFVVVGPAEVGQYDNVRAAIDAAMAFAATEPEDAE